VSMSSLPPSGPSLPPPLPELPELPEGVEPTPVPACPPVDRREGRLPDWPAWTAPAALVSALLIALAGGVVVAIVAAALGASVDHLTPAANIAATVVQDAAFVGAVILFGQRSGPLIPAQLGLRRTRLGAAVGWSALTVLAFFVLSGIWATLVDINQRDELPNDFGVHQSTVALVAVCVLVTVIAPIAEELLFRGYMFTALRTWRGPWVAAVLTGIAFGAVHVASAPVVFLVPLAILGFLLCLLRWRTGSLLPCIGVHAFNNAIAFGVNEVSWNAGQVMLLILGAVTAVMLVVWPFVGRGERVAPARA
jgi:CAAX protease family protein